MQKFQIFISSTFTDLEEERDQVIKAVLEMGHIPVGMEMFSAADEEQWQIIARHIDETDYYVVILGHRYGSTVGDVSYTEKEFDYAVSKGIPTYGFIVDSGVEPLAKNVDTEEMKRLALSNFATKVKIRPVSFWKSADDLGGKVSRALTKAFVTTPRVGWSRATTSSGPEVSQELSRLSKENAELRSQLALTELQKSGDKKAHATSVLSTLSSVPVTIHLREHGNPEWAIKVKTSLFRVFSNLAPELMVELSVDGSSDYLGIVYKPDTVARLSSTAPVAFNQVASLLVDLASFDLVEPSKRKHPVSDTDAYWSLTEFGREVLKLHRVTALELKASRERERKKASGSTDDAETNPV